MIAGDGDERDSVVSEISRLALGSPRPLARRRSRATERSRSLRARPTRPLLSSSWENFPHSGRRVARGRDAGDLDRTSVASQRSSPTASNGLLVPVGDTAALAAAIERYLQRRRPARRRFARTRLASVAAYSTENVLGAIIDRLEEAVR